MAVDRSLFLCDKPALDPSTGKLLEGVSETLEDGSPAVVRLDVQLVMQSQIDAEKGLPLIIVSGPSPASTKSALRADLFLPFAFRAGHVRQPRLVHVHPAPFLRCINCCTIVPSHHPLLSFRLPSGVQAMMYATGSPITMRCALCRARKREKV